MIDLFILTSSNRNMLYKAHPYLSNIYLRVSWLSWPSQNLIREAKSDVRLASTPTTPGDRLNSIRLKPWASTQKNLYFIGYITCVHVLTHVDPCCIIYHVYMEFVIGLSLLVIKQVSWRREKEFLHAHGNFLPSNCTRKKNKFLRGALAVKVTFILWSKLQMIISLPQSQFLIICIDFAW